MPEMPLLTIVAAVLGFASLLLATPLANGNNDNNARRTPCGETHFPIAPTAVPTATPTPLVTLLHYGDYECNACYAEPKEIYITNSSCQMLPVGSIRVVGWDEGKVTPGSLHSWTGGQQCSGQATTLDFDSERCYGYHEKLLHEVRVDVYGGR